MLQCCCCVCGIHKIWIINGLNKFITIKLNWRSIFFFIFFLLTEKKNKTHFFKCKHLPILTWILSSARTSVQWIQEWHFCPQDQSAVLLLVAGRCTTFLLQLKRAAGVCVWWDQVARRNSSVHPPQSWRELERRQAGPQLVFWMASHLLEEIQ